MERKRAWLYCRTAKPDVVESLDYQLFCIRNLAKNQGYEIVGITKEYSNGKDMNRSGLSEVTTAAEKGRIDIVVVQNLSRIGRSNRTMSEYRGMLKAYGVELVSANEISMADTTEEWHYKLDMWMKKIYKLKYGVDVDVIDILENP